MAMVKLEGALLLIDHWVIVDPSAALDVTHCYDLLILSNAHLCHTCLTHLVVYNLSFFIL